MMHQIRVEVQIRYLEDKEAKTPSQNSKKKKIQKNEDSIRSLWGNFKCINIHIMEVLEGEKIEQELKTYVKK